MSFEALEMGDFPVIYLGMLAVARRYQGNGLGKIIMSPTQMPPPRPLPPALHEER